MMYPARHAHQTLAIADRVLDVLVQLNRHILVMLIIPVGMIWWYPSYQARDKALQENRRLLQEKAKVEAEVIALNRKISHLQHHPEYLEAIARDRLQMQKEGEWIMRFEKRADP